jgi:hypothetical protein
MLVSLGWLPDTRERRGGEEMRIHYENVTRPFPKRNRFGTEYVWHRERLLWTVRCFHGNLMSDPTGCGWEGLTIYDKKANAKSALEMLNERGGVHGHLPV